MRKKDLYLEDAAEYYRKRYKRASRRGRAVRIMGILGGILLALALGCTTVYAVAGLGGGRRSSAPRVRPEETVTSGDGWEEIPSGQWGMPDSGTNGEAQTKEAALAEETDETGESGAEGSGHYGGVPGDRKLAVTGREEILIVLDPGHGGEDEGCTRYGVLEKDINLQIAQAVREKLEELGYRVMLTRDGDESLSLEERVRIANEAHARLYVSIHQNACEENGPEGVEVWYSEKTRGEASERLARLVGKFVVQETGAEDREVCETDSLYVIRESNMPSCLIETGFLSNHSERASLSSPEYQSRIASGIADGIELYFYPKTMYLTFDDGPSAENTDAVLDILKERGIHATFFVVGENVRAHPEVAQRIVEEGHTIGIHCDSHDYEEIYASVDSYVADFEKAYRTVYEVTGVEAKLFRFPGGSKNAYNGEVYQEIIREMTDRGFLYYDWNASFEDAVRNPDPERLTQNAVSTTLGRKRVIMLAHDVVYATAVCLEDVLDAFPEYRMLPLTEEVEPIRF